MADQIDKAYEQFLKSGSTPLGFRHAVREVWLDWACEDWRGIDQKYLCPDCGGSGTKAYPSTATWHGGVGGMTITTDVCDRCWGSGDRAKPWPSRRR